jgi:hypothetical protein
MTKGFCELNGKFKISLNRETARRFVQGRHPVLSRTRKLAFRRKAVMAKAWKFIPTAVVCNSVKQHFALAPRMT